MPHIRKHILEEVAIILGKTTPGNPQAIATLLKVIETTEDENIRWQAADSLGKIDLGNPQAIVALLKIIETTEDENIRWRAADSLVKIDPGNPQAIVTLLEVRETIRNTFIRRAADSLFEIGQGNPQDIATLVEVLENTENKVIRRRAVESLGKIDPGNSQAIVALIKVIETTGDESIRRRAADSLVKIGQGNSQAIAALVKVIETTGDENIRWQAADSLGKIDPGNPQAIAVLVKVIETTGDKFIHRRAVDSLSKIDPGNPQAIAVLIKVIETTGDEDIRRRAAKNLKKNVITNEQQQNVVSALKPNLNNETYENNFSLFKHCYTILWNIAQNLSYPDLYRAWHGLNETQTSPLVQTLNLAQLPQFLQTQLTETNLHETLQLFCIDTSKFIDTDNPALEIYEQFLDQNCPQHPNREPETLAQLKSYWNRLCRDSDKHLILIFYESPTSPAAQGLNPTFLNALTRFDGTICLIADTPHPPLQTFSPHDSDLLENIVNWLDRLHLES